MNIKRIVRDAFIMISFCGTFYVSTFMWGKVDNKPPLDTNFSSSRMSADEFIKTRQWEMAADRYKRMTESDPFNGYAWYRLGTCYNNLRFETQYQIRMERESPSPSAKKIESWIEDVANYDLSALEAHRRAREFLRYRGKSLYQMAIIHADRSEYSAALEILQEFIDNGHWTFNGLDKIDRLGAGDRSVVQNEEANSITRLHAFEKFWELVDKEDRHANGGTATKKRKSLDQ
jgi:tetratricopeptide (TPR) repeat protein